MPTLHKTITIGSPVEKVFDVLADPTRIPQYAPGVSRVSEIRQSEAHVGDSCRLAYTVMGLRFPMKLTATEYNRPSKIGSRMEGGMRGDWHWALEPQGTATKVDLDIDYEMRGGIIGRAMNALIVERMNEKNAQRMLENLKAVVERAT